MFTPLRDHLPLKQGSSGGHETRDEALERLVEARPVSRVRQSRVNRKDHLPLKQGLRHSDRMATNLHIRAISETIFH